MSDDLNMHRIMSGPYHLNSYVLVCDTTRECLVVDPGGNAGVLADFLKTRNLVPVRLLLTHGHADPFFRFEDFKVVWDVPYCVHKADDAFFRRPDVRAEIQRTAGLPPPYPADISLAHGDAVRFGRHSLSVIHTPGHTPGSVCFLWEDRLLTGDTLFVGEAGRTDLPGGDLDTLVASIRDRILPLPPEAGIFPGHHRPGTRASSTLTREMSDNIYITDFILDP